MSPPIKEVQMHKHHHLTHKEEVKGGEHSHPDHHHKAIKHHMAALHKMAKHGHKHHASAHHHKKAK